MVTRDQADAAALAAILDYYGTAARDITVVRIRPEEIEDLASRRLDALAFMAAPGTDEAARIISAASGALGGTIAAVPLEGLEPLTHRARFLDKCPATNKDPGRFFHKKNKGGRPPFKPTKAHRSDVVLLGTAHEPGVQC